MNAGLFPGFVGGHNGTYMNEFGLSFHSLRARVYLASEDGEILGKSDSLASWCLSDGWLVLYLCLEYLYKKMTPEH